MSETPIKDVAQSQFRTLDSASINRAWNGPTVYRDPVTGASDPHMSDSETVNIPSLRSPEPENINTEVPQVSVNSRGGRWSRMFGIAGALLGLGSGVALITTGVVTNLLGPKDSSSVPNTDSTSQTTGSTGDSGAVGDAPSEEPLPSPDKTGLPVAPVANPDSPTASVTSSTGTPGSTETRAPSPTPSAEPTGTVAPSPSAVPTGTSQSTG